MTSEGLHQLRKIVDDLGKRRIDVGNFHTQNETEFASIARVTQEATTELLELLRDRIYWICHYYDLDDGEVWVSFQYDEVLVEVHKELERKEVLTNFLKAAGFKLYKKSKCYEEWTIKQL